jgi:carboxylesterase type B
MSITAAQANLVEEIQTRWVAFADGASPNAVGLREWRPITQRSLNMLVFGPNGVGTSPFNARLCDPKASLLLGRVIPFDQQQSQSHPEST